MPACRGRADRGLLRAAAEPPGSARRNQLLQAAAGEVRPARESVGGPARPRRPRATPAAASRPDPSAAPGNTFGVLHELRVENLLLLERAELRLAPGLNVLTGETGAGKTLLAHALDLLLGGKARHGIVRAGAAEAYVEGIFELPDELRGHEVIPEAAAEVVLARRVWPDGRTRAYVCGRSATVADLRELGGRLLAFYGQHEHRKLMLSSVQLEALDAHCGPRQPGRRARMAQSYARVRMLEERVRQLASVAGARDRELDLLKFELDEIEAVAPSQDEQASLAAERERLRHIELLRSAAGTAAESIAPETGGGVCELLACAAPALEQAAVL